MVTMQVATLNEDGAVRMPASTEYVFIEIGCNDRDTLDNQVLPDHPNAFLISFEPMLDKLRQVCGAGFARDLALPRQMGGYGSSTRASSPARCVHAVGCKLDGGAGQTTREPCCGLLVATTTAEAIEAMDFLV